MRVMTVDEDTGLLLLPTTYVTRHGQTPSNSHRLIVRSGVLPGQILCGGRLLPSIFFLFPSPRLSLPLPILSKSPRVRPFPSH